MREEALSQGFKEQDLKEKRKANGEPKEMVHQLVTAGLGDFKSE